MKPACAAILGFLLLCAPSWGQDGDQPETQQPAAAMPKVTGATIPILRTPGPESVPDLPVGGAARWGGNGQPSQPGTQIAPESTISGAGMVVTRPAEGEQDVRPLPRVETPSQIAADQAIRKQADTDISAYAARVSDTCDADLKARIDWTAIDPQEIHTGSPADACGAALQAIGELCANDAAKRRVAQQIKSVICTGGPTPSVELHAGTMLYTVDWQSRNPGSAVYAWLASHL